MLWLALTGAIRQPFPPSLADALVVSSGLVHVDCFNADKSIGEPPTSVAIGGLKGSDPAPLAVLCAVFDPGPPY